MEGSRFYSGVVLKGSFDHGSPIVHGPDWRLGRRRGLGRLPLLFVAPGRRTRQAGIVRPLDAGWGAGLKGGVQERRGRFSL